MKTAELLAALAGKLNDKRFGPDSKDVEDFLKEHKDNPDFVRLGRLSVALKRALAPPPNGRGTEHQEGEVTEEPCENEYEDGVY